MQYEQVSEAEFLDLKKIFNACWHSKLLILTITLFFIVFQHLVFPYIPNKHTVVLEVKALDTTEKTKFIPVEALTSPKPASKIFLPLRNRIQSDVPVAFFPIVASVLEARFYDKVSDPAVLRSFLVLSTELQGFDDLSATDLEEKLRDFRRSLIVSPTTYRDNVVQERASISFQISDPNMADALAKELVALSNLAVFHDLRTELESKLLFLKIALDANQRDMQHIGDQYRREKNAQLVEVIETLEEHAQIARSLGFVGLADLPKKIYSSENEEFPLYFLLGYQNIEGMIVSLKARLEAQQKKSFDMEASSSANDAVFKSFSEEVRKAVDTTPLGKPEDFAAVKYIAESTSVVSGVNRFLFASLATFVGFLIGAGMAIYRYEQS